MSGSAREPLTAVPERRVWVPATPLPFFGFRKKCMQRRCGRKFWRTATYERHWAEAHALGVAQSDRAEPRMDAEMTYSEAMRRGYGALLAWRAEGETIPPEHVQPREVGQ